MRNAYALLGFSFLIVFVGAYIVIRKANAPTSNELIQKEEATSTVTSKPNETSSMLTLTSPAFEDGGSIPSTYTCDGTNVNPEIRISGVPEGTESLVLIMDDPDIPDAVKQSRGVEKFDHWVLYAIPKDTTVISEGSPVGTEGLTSAGTTGYTGPCPPDKEHRYIFRLYALSGTLNFIKAPTLDEVEEAAKGMTIASATLMGRYNRVSN